MLNINLSTPENVILDIRDNFKNRRLSFKLTQNALAKKSGVSLGSLKRFESSGAISLESLLKLSLVLECLEEFSTLCKKHSAKFSSIDELIESSKKSNTPKRGTKK
ncbi:MAG: helix-turn-helix domain-containing protein [Helicobacteraceae bacterium]|nr:helix-turn-helix domain-containing protein [Helicobacteraceae bacterium]